MSTPDVVRRYLTALSNHDVDAILACVAPSFANEHVSALGASGVGRETYAGRLPGFLAQFTSLNYELVESITETAGDVTRSAVRYRMTASFDGHPIDIPGVMLFEIGDGLIARRTDVWDSLTFLRQTGQA